MEQAVLKTLIYADIFAYPLKTWEIHKWLIGKKSNLSQVEKAVIRLEKKKKIFSKNGVYYLKGKKKNIEEREQREFVSVHFRRKAFVVAQCIKIIPWIKLVGISGSLAMKNAGEKDDIDLFVVTASNRLWISRIFLLLLLGFLGVRRRRSDVREKSKGKICVNTLLEQDGLALNNGTIYLAHEVLQMEPLWQREKVYSKYLEENLWAFSFLPNWTTSSLSAVTFSRNRNEVGKVINQLEKLVKWLQLRYMGKVSGDEKILAHGLFFHPHDVGPSILKKYEKGIKVL